MTCYICEPDNPDADEEGCTSCERAYIAHISRLHAALYGPTR